MNSTCFLLSLLGLMLWTTQGDPVAEKKDGKLACILILNENEVAVGKTISAEVILKNTSEKRFEIVSRAHPFEGLDLIVIGPSGKKISRSHYGGLFSPYDKEKVFTLEPGGSFRHSVGVKATSAPEAWTQPGVYKIIAEYAYKKEKAVSKQVELKILPK